MKTTSKILIVLCLLAAVVLAVQVAAVAGNVIRDGHAAEAEERMRSETEEHLAAARIKVAQVPPQHAAILASMQQDTSRRKAEADGLKKLAEAVETARDEVVAQYTVVDKAASDAAKKPATLQVLEGVFRDAAAARAMDLDSAQKSSADQMEQVGIARKRNASARLKYDSLEFGLYMMSADLQRRLERTAVYRWLRPDLQASIADNGVSLSPRESVTGTVSSAKGSSVTINRGSEQGVELYQQFLVMRGTQIVAEARVISVSNHAAELEVQSVAGKASGVEPRTGDIVELKKLWGSGLGEVGR